MLPLGSTPELSSYKGYGLAIMLEVLCAGLAGGPIMPANGEPRRAHWFAAIDLRQIVEPAIFAELMDDMLGRLRGSQPAAGHDRVLVAGERELAHRQEAERRGAPLHANTLAGLRRLAGEVGLEPPA